MSKDVYDEISNEEYIHTIRFKNRNDTPLIILVEPWPEMYELGLNDELVVMAKMPKGKFPEIGYGKYDDIDMIEYLPLSKCQLMIYKNGKLIEDDLVL
ncbi:MAG TPA: hypothetical protein VLL52_00140 [Anaerolineae bacterium]|nr:hypothetical protein [Anaerolineae bacterium]